jgi:hypothetical protein
MISEENQKWYSGYPIKSETVVLFEAEDRLRKEKGGSTIFSILEIDVTLIGTDMPIMG